MILKLQLFTHEKARKIENIISENGKIPFEY